MWLDFGVWTIATLCWECRLWAQIQDNVGPRPYLPFPHHAFILMFSSQFIYWLETSYLSIPMVLTSLIKCFCCLFSVTYLMLQPLCPTFLSNHIRLSSWWIRNFSRDSLFLILLLILILIENGGTIAEYGCQPLSYGDTNSCLLYVHADCASCLDGGWFVQQSIRPDWAIF